MTILRPAILRQNQRQPVRLLRGLSGYILLALVATPASSEGNSPQPEFTKSNILVKASQFQSVVNPTYQNPFQLLGVVTFVDTNRNLLVLQDDTAAIALTIDLSALALAPGQYISVIASEGLPSVESFPKYPYQPSGSAIRSSFQIPPNRGNYHLNRLRGYLRPQSTGLYSFWIASDNSSELWLSPDEDPANAKQIAFIKAGNWVNAREWSRYPSQRSNPIALQAGQSYYIEALHEQVLLNEHLSVAWQKQSGPPAVIDWSSLTPWVGKTKQPDGPRTDGILWEYWTNFTAGDLNEIVSRGPFKSILSLKDPQISVLGNRVFPKPRMITLDEPLPLESNYRWVEVVGTVSFAGIDGDAVSLEITGQTGSARVYAAKAWGSVLRSLPDQQIRVQGVCEGMLTANGQLIPNTIWVPRPSLITIESQPPTNAPNKTVSQQSGLTPESPLSDDLGQAWNSFSSFRGVVTFNDRVLGKSCLYMQNDVTGLFVSQSELVLPGLQLGEWVVIGGILQPEKYSPSLVPITASSLGWRAMPAPLKHSPGIGTLASRNGRWLEMEGVIHSVHTNGTMLLVGNGSRISVWLGHTAADQIRRLVGAALRVRGVLSLDILNEPLLLVPSQNFVEIQSAAEEDPFLIPASYTTDLTNGLMQLKWVQRVKLNGVVTYRDERLVFIQDARGGVRAEFEEAPAVRVGDLVEMVGFPETGGGARTLTEALIRVTRSTNVNGIRPVEFKVARAPDFQGRLVSMKATLLAQNTNGSEFLLDVQAGQQIHQLVLRTAHGRLPDFELGSQLGINGVCNFIRAETGDAKAGGNFADLHSIELLLRSPQDVVVLRGPPLWASKGLALLVGILVAVTASGLLVIYIYRRRLERQRLAKLTFSRQILQSQEEERRRIALNLHDSLGQNLLFIKNHSRLSKSPMTDEGAVRGRLDEIAEVATQAIDEVRKITHNLRPYQLDRLGLTQALRAVIKQASSGVQIEFATSVEEIDGIFDKESEIHIYRIIQECLNNIVKHSGATEVTVVVKKQGSQVLLSVRDNGCGFDTSLDRSVGLGLNSINERALILGGKSKFESFPNGGANLYCEIPIQQPVT
jgi:signal transduction histidine kinase